MALTFDDGPTAITDSVLLILKRYNVHASFFFTGEEMSRHPDIVKRVIADGHSIGNHSYTHKRMMLKSPAWIRNEIERTDSIIKACGFSQRIYFRPPYCKKLFYLPYYLWRTNRTTVTWSVEPDSEVSQNSEEILECVKKEIKPGSIILLHVMYLDRRASLTALPRIIELLQREHYAMVTVNDLLESAK